MSNPSLFSNASQSAASPITDGDAILLIKPGGEVTPLTVGINAVIAEGVREKDIEDLNAEELAMAIQGQVLFLLIMAAKSQPIMEFLGKVSLAHGATDYDKMKNVAMMH